MFEGIFRNPLLAGLLGILGLGMPHSEATGAPVIPSDWATEIENDADASVSPSGDVNLRVFKTSTARATADLGDLNGTLRISFDYEYIAEGWWEDPYLRIVSGSGEQYYSDLEGQSRPLVIHPEAYSTVTGHLDAFVELDGQTYVIFELVPSPHSASSDHLNSYFNLTNVSFTILPEQVPEIEVRSDGLILEDGGGPIDFASSPVGSEPSTRTILIDNIGEGDLITSGLSVDAPFQVTDSLPERISVIQRNWVQELSSAPFVSRSQFGGLVYDGKIWVIGGASGTGRMNDVWYSENGTAWQNATVSAAFEKRIAIPVVEFDGKMYLTGGLSGSGSSRQGHNDVWSSTDGIQWNAENTSASFPARWSHAATTLDSRILLSGGGTLSENFNDVWQSENGADWVQLTDAAGFLPRKSHVMIAFKGALWVIGGDAYPTYYNDVWKSQDGSQWELVTEDAGFAPRAGHSAFVYEDKLWITGGDNADVAMNDLWFTSDGQAWYEYNLTSSYSERTLAEAVVFDEKIWIIAGKIAGSGSGTRLKDIWSISDDIGSFTVSLPATNSGLFEGEVSFNNNDADENPFNFTVSGEVTEPIGEGEPEISVLMDGVNIPNSGGPIDFGTATLDLEAPGKTFAVNNIGTGTLEISNLTLSDGFLLTEGLDFTIPAGDSDSFTVTLDTSSSGTFSGEISIENNDSDENPFTFSVSGTVTDEPLSLKTREDFELSGPEGGPFAPDEKLYTIQNRGDQSTSWTVTASESWVMLDRDGGNIEPDFSDIITVSIDQDAAQNFTMDTNTATITFRNEASGSVFGSVEVVVALQHPASFTISTDRTDYATGDLVTLRSTVDDTGSGSEVIYSWRELPSNRELGLINESNRNQSQVQFQISLPGTYDFELVINNGQLNSDPQRLTLYVAGVFGRVTLGHTNKFIPVTPMNITLAPENYITSADANGLFDFLGLEVEDVGNVRQLTFEKPDNPDFPESFRQVIVGRSGQYLEHEAFGPSRSISGIVRDQAGEPLSDVVVRAWAGPNKVTTSQGGASAGSFTLNDVPYGSWTFSFTHPSEGYRQIPVSMGLDTPPLDISLQRASYATLSGIVVAGDTGIPVENVDVTIDGVNSMRTEEDGSYTLAEVPTGTVTVVAQAVEGSGSFFEPGKFQTYFKDVNVTTGGTSLEIRMQGGRWGIYGEVLGAGGEPISGATVEVVTANNEPQISRTLLNAASMTEQTGFYTLPRLARGSRELTFEAPGYAPKTVPVELDSFKQLQVALEPMGSQEADRPGVTVIGRQTTTEKRPVEFIITFDRPVVGLELNDVFVEGADKQSITGNGVSFLLRVEPGARTIRCRVPDGVTTTDDEVTNRESNTAEVTFVGAGAVDWKRYQ